MEILSCKGLSFAYKDSEDFALEDCAFAVEKGEKVLLCGLSGSGKSTLLKLLKRELAPIGRTAGEIRLFGASQEGVSERESARRIGFVMQDPDAQTVCDKVSAELAFGLENLGVKSGEILSRVGEMAAFFGIERLYDRDISTLSGGQKQLVNLCAVMVMNPDILLLDEPTAQLDPVAARDFLSILERLNKELGLTVIIAEHQPEGIFDSCDRVLYMENGRVKLFAEPKKAAEYFADNGLTEFLPRSAAVFEGIVNGELPLDVRSAKRRFAEIVEDSVGDRMTAEQVGRRGRRPLHQQSAEVKSDMVLQAENVWQRYEKDLPDVIKGADLRLFKGECYGLLGSNGVGKSTFVKVLCGLERAYMGRVKVMGKGLKSYKNGALFRNMLAVMPQKPVTMFIRETVREDFLLTLSHMGGRFEENEQAIQDCAKRLGIGELLERQPYDLSGGEIQKCAFGKIMLSCPQIMILDECTKGLDGFGKKALGEIIEGFKAEGITLLIVTHDLEFAAQYCDRCGLFFEGKIVSEGGSAEFFSKNSFYTTAAARITRGIAEDIVTVGQAREYLASLHKAKGLE
ncbi:ABC transporter ATP-binding protein [Ruminococcus sp.]|uniref:ABC transporter ATP-binding protein n=1 Tax=Ruminococcus sp. TaxID=41978 RepID=UPI0025CCAF0C|nr:ABC transporter ATP-binding protein [Ruminococcus sp.]